MNVCFLLPLTASGRLDRVCENARGKLVSLAGLDELSDRLWPFVETTVLFDFSLFCSSLPRRKVSRWKLSSGDFLRFIGIFLFLFFSFASIDRSFGDRSRLLLRSLRGKGAYT